MFQQVTGVTLPRTAKDMSHLGKEVDVADLQPGDLVFFNTRRFAFSHVGIYLGDNQFVHAPRRGREVEVATLDSGFWQTPIQRRAADGRRAAEPRFPRSSARPSRRRSRCPEADEIPTPSARRA